MKKVQTTYRTCPKDGFPLVKVRGRWECVAEYLDRCIGNKRIVDVVQRDEITHYVFEDGHELPLLCFCCDGPLVSGDADGQSLADEKREMQKRRLNDMAVTFGILDDGTERAQLRLFFSKGLRNQVEIPVSIEVAARMRHPDDCPHRGVPPKNKLPRARRRKRKR